MAKRDFRRDRRVSWLAFKIFAQRFEGVNLLSSALDVEEVLELGW